MTFTGVLNDKMRGFYRSKYQSPDGEDRYAAVTQFEVTTKNIDISEFYFPFLCSKVVKLFVVKL